MASALAGICILQASVLRVRSKPNRLLALMGREDGERGRVVNLLAALVLIVVALALPGAWWHALILPAVAASLALIICGLQNRPLRRVAPVADDGRASADWAPAADGEE